MVQGPVENPVMFTGGPAGYPRHQATFYLPPFLNSFLFRRRKGVALEGKSAETYRQAMTTPLLLDVLAGTTTDRPPVWFMRQAGRYLPEYRALRAQAPDFIAFCLNPEMAAEATLQPMRRFGFDAAIVFADILLIPGALRQEVWFEAGEGPRLGIMPSVESMADRAAGAGEYLQRIGQTLSIVRSALEPEKALIGFAGAPWTVATYA